VSTLSAVVDRVAPRSSEQRVLLQLGKTALNEPWRLPQRINRRNISTWRRFRRLEIRCNVCRQQGRPLYGFPDLKLRSDHGIGVLRETLTCRGCMSTMRDRTLAAAVLDTIAMRVGQRAADATALPDLLPSGFCILDTDSFGPFSKAMSQDGRYLRTVYLPDKPNGAEIEAGRVFNADLERLPFPDASFDLVLTSDVMEHVRNDVAAHREIARVLRPGGHYIFTVPYDEAAARTRVLIDTATEVDIPLEPLHVHGDPIRGGIKAYRIYGVELLEQLRTLGFDAQLRRVDDPAAGIFGGDVIVAALR
jgi:SAM-dependent methyltransferase